MDRKSFIQKAGISLAGFVGALSVTTPFSTHGRYSHRESKNWAWITEPEGTKDEWKRRLETLKKAGFDAILPQENFDTIIPAAEANDIEVHAWLVSCSAAVMPKPKKNIPNGLPLTGKVNHH